MVAQSVGQAPSVLEVVVCQSDLRYWVVGYAKFIDQSQTCNRPDRGDIELTTGLSGEDPSSSYPRQQFSGRSTSANGNETSHYLNQPRVYLVHKDHDMDEINLDCRLYEGKSQSSICIYAGLTTRKAH